VARAVREREPVRHPSGEVLRATKGQSTMKDDTHATGSAAPVAVALSALVEGLGQAYNRQPAKAAGFLVAGLTLSTASGLNTWLVRNVFGLRGTRIGPERVNPALLAAWAATYALNLADAWGNAHAARGAA
jgi:hypothetical protein